MARLGRISPASKIISNGSTLLHSADGTKFASSSGDKTARPWDGKTGSLQVIASLEGHSLRVYSVAFSADCSKRISDLSFLAHPNYLHLLIERTQPVLRGLVAVKLDDDSSLDPMHFVWFPHNFPDRRLVVDPSGRASPLGWYIPGYFAIIFVYPYHLFLTTLQSNEFPNDLHTLLNIHDKFPRLQPM